MKPYIQVQYQQSTLEHWKRILAGNKLSSFAAFAYVTDSGVAQIGTQLRSDLGKSRDCRWLCGVDFGRTHPTALKKLKGIGKSVIRIHDGEYVVQSRAFTPRVSFHLKTALTLQTNGYPCQQIVGSGNLSASGLLSGIEAGCIIDYSQVRRRHGAALIATLEEMWEKATPLENVLHDYQSRYAAMIQPTVFGPDDDHTDPQGTTLFWIDIGYVTKNRGEEKPGNQFDLPRGSHIFLGLKKVRNPERNSVLGELEIRTPTGDVLARRLRHGNNDMEKLTLPIPEQYGYHSYDGKILTFAVDGDEVVLEAYEPEDFYRIYGRRVSSVSEMRGGRKYGTISLPH
jgi:HKD family nuclease